MPVMQRLTLENHHCTKPEKYRNNEHKNEIKNLFLVSSIKTKKEESQKTIVLTAQVYENANSSGRKAAPIRDGRIMENMDAVGTDSNKAEPFAPKF